MDRRTFLTAALASPALLALLQACGSDTPASSNTGNTGGSNSTTPPNGEGVARSSISRIAASKDESAEAVKVVNDFGVDMYHRLATPDPSASTPAPVNLVFSPASIAIALAMTRVGAVGPTGTEMDAVLHASSAETLPRSMNALTTELTARSKTVPVPGAEPGAEPDAEPSTVELSIANSLWAQEGLAFEEVFLDTLAAEYGAGLNLVDYKSDPDAARVLINQWVDDATKERIPELLAPGVITGDARLTLVNAIYMKAAWLSTFSESATAPGPFTTSSGSTVQAPMMTQTEHFEYASTSGWQAVLLPYVGNDLSMLIGLPDPGSPSGGVVAALAGIAGQFAPQRVTVTMPKFDIETAVGLGDLLAAMGMPTAFDRLTADFSGMTTEERLFIAAVIHQANITVDEEGTEAAAATAVVMEATSAPIEQDPIDFRVDRPFVFAIRDNPTGAILFLGHIGDPTAG